MKNLLKNYRQIILIAIVIILPLILFRNYNQASLLKLGYLGIFFINFITSATVFIPIPGAATAFLGGAVLNPFLVGIAAGVGATLGEMFGFLTGYQGRNLLDKYKRRIKWLSKVEDFFKINGFLTILVCALLPFPFFDFIGVLAGVMGYSFPKFMLATFIGRVVRDIFFAIFGAKILPY